VAVLRADIKIELQGIADGSKVGSISLKSFSLDHLKDLESIVREGFEGPVTFTGAGKIIPREEQSCQS
jgi:hypothetical protein